MSVHMCWIVGDSCSTIRHVHSRAGDHSDVWPLLRGVCHGHAHPYSHQMVAGRMWVCYQLPLPCTPVVMWPPFLLFIFSFFFSFFFICFFFSFFFSFVFFFFSIFPNSGLHYDTCRGIGQTDNEGAGPRHPSLYCPTQKPGRPHPLARLLKTVSVLLQGIYRCVLIPFHSGVKVGNIGPNAGMPSGDNGFLQLSQVRIPRDHMLMRYSQVASDGTYSKPPTSKLTYGALVRTRCGMVLSFAGGLARAVTVATRYSVVRKQGRSSPGSVGITNGPFTITSFWGGKVSIKWRKCMEMYAFM